MGEQSGERYVVLDGLRGLAAIAVAVCHIGKIGGRHDLPGAYIMVDFFFILSGFVLAASYGDKLGRGLSAIAFLRKRVFRLWPLYSLGALLAGGFALTQGTSDIYGAAGHAPTWAWLTAAVEFTGLPALHSLDGRLYPFNFPAWSLFFELMINAAYGLTATRLAGWRLAVPIGVGVAGVVASTLIAGSLDTGARWDQFGFGLARVTFAFFAGVMLRRVFVARRLAPRASDAAVAAIGLSLVSVLAVDHTALGDSVKAIVLLPLIVWMGAHLRPKSARVIKACALLGALSYPLYVTHIGVRYWMAAAASAGDIPVDRTYLFATLAVALAVAWAAVQLYEPGLKRMLRIA